MTPQRAALLILTVALGVLAIWLLRHFLAALAWAVVLAVATWPLYCRFLALRPQPRQAAISAPLTFTLLIGLVFVLPLTLLAFEVGREALILARWARAAEESGVPVPDWLGHVPFGGYVAEWWRTNLTDPGAAQVLIGRLDRSVVLEWTRSIGIQLLARSTILVFTLLALFFLYRDGNALARQVGGMANRAFGPAGEQLRRQVVTAIRGTVDGLVLVGLGEGLILGVAYAIAGLPHAGLLGALTSVLAMIPFGAPVVFGLGALYLVAQSSLAAAIAVAALGVAVTFVADHFVRPVLIGGAARLSFIWVLLGILGGVESFGLIGLFLGPAIMAAFAVLWRQWAEGAPEAASQQPRIFRDRSAPPD